MAYIKIMAIIFAGELCIKDCIEEKIDDSANIPVLSGVMRISKHHNKGASFNLGNMKLKTVTAVSVVFTVFMLGVFTATMFTKGNVLLKTGLSLLLGGAFSNTYDRLHRKYVVDYFSFHTGSETLDRIIFNISDFCIATGAAMAAAVVIAKKD